MSTECKKRVGIMGGTFDPIHNGHLILAEQAYEQFHLDKILFLPNGNPPHKPVRDGGASNQDRLEMVRLAILGNSHFELDTEEMERYGCSYTKDTLKRLTESFPDTTFYFIIGADSLMSFETWYKPEEIARYCILLAAVRDKMAPEDMRRQIAHLHEKYQANIEILGTPDLDISSSSLRKMHRRSQSIRYFLPDAVYDYIKAAGLYRDNAAV